MVYIDKKRVKKLKSGFAGFGKGIVKVGKRLDTSLKKYEAGAPQRQRAEVAKLQSQIKTEKLRQQLRKLKEKSKPQEWGGGF